MKTIGPSFFDEIKAAGLAGLDFAYGADGAFVFDPRMTPEQIAAVEAVYAAHEPVPSRASVNAALVESVDSTISAIYSRFTRFESEYVLREAAARAFRAAGNQGDAGVWVNSFATNAGMNSKAAADLIIGQADGMRSALQALGALRMRKYGIAAAASPAAAQAVHDDIVAKAMTIAAAL